MLGQALVLTLLLLLKGNQGQDSAEHVVGLSGNQLSLLPPRTQTKQINSARWKMQRHSSSGFSVILIWKNGSEVWTPNHLKKTFNFIKRNLTLLIKTAQQNDSGLYLLEVTDDSGRVENHQFQVSVFEYTSVNFLMIIVIFLITLLLGALTCFCVWRRKRKQSETSQGETLTVYEDVNTMQNRSNQEQRQNRPGEGSTMYSVIRSQSSAPTSRETKTLYALVQPSWKSESKKKKNQSSSSSYTIYEEVGKRRLKAQNPARLSRKELENFCVYS
ncbi:natural killer cell receptor 2B4 isoform X2 [Halichoerus grypus]|uniref:natural killer cell receptor 2B4 isoform X3 n=1 Tax=Halichoerus grypus TaxID=9711 RepID=UPI00165A0D81|nr:natural killer cell receptor 2B4 isoform X3 [Halichoerus grypus]